MQHPEEPEAVDERRAAEIVGLAPATLKKYRTRGGGPPYVRYGRRAIRYRVEDLRAWRDAKVVAHTGAAT